jgi:hypothetical protein
MDRHEPELISKEPWWAEPPKPGQAESEVEWGYLELYSDGKFKFDRTTPSQDEILERTSCRIFVNN